MSAFSAGDLLVIPGRRVAEVLTVGTETYDLYVFSPGQGLVTVAQASLEATAQKMVGTSPAPTFMPAPLSEIFWRSNGQQSKAEGGAAPLVGDSQHSVYQGAFSISGGVAGNLYALTEDGDGNSVWVADIEIVAVLSGPPALP